MSWYKEINQVKVGDPVKSPRNGSGIVTKVTKRTITVTFENGNTVKNTYRYSDAPFFESEF